MKLATVFVYPQCKQMVFILCKQAWSGVHYIIIYIDIVYIYIYIIYIDLLDMLIYDNMCRSRYIVCNVKMYCVC